jgi:hypothetical protein
MRRLWRDYGLSIVLTIAFVASLVAAAVTGWIEFVAEQGSHGQPPELFGPQGYFWTLAEQVTQNWQSEFLAIFSLIALTSFPIHRGSPMSPEGKAEMLERIRKLSRRVDALAAEGER